MPLKVIADDVVKNPVFRDASGAFSKARFEQLLASNGFTEASYINAERFNRLRRMVSETATEEITVPDVIKKAIFQHQNERRRAKYFVLPVEKVANVGEPDESALKAYYDANKSLFRAPEYRELTLLRLEPEDLASTISVSSDAIAAAYKESLADYTTPEKRRAEQIVFATLKEAEAAHKKITGGADFLQVAKDRGFTEEDIDLGEVTRKSVPDKIVAKAIFSLKKGAVSKPIAGSLSVVLLRVTKITPKKVKSFAQVKEAVKTKIIHEKALEEILNIHDAVEDERAGGASFREISKKLNLPIFKIAAVDRNGLGPDGKKVKDLTNPDAVLPIVFEAGVGTENDPVDTDHDGFVWFEVDAVTPASTWPLAKVRDKVVKLWQQQRRRELLSDRAKEFAKRIEGGEALEAVAATVPAKVVSSSLLKRQDNDEVLTRSALTKLFSVPPDGLATEIAADGTNALIMQLQEVSVPTYDPSSEESKALAGFLKQGLSEDLIQQFLVSMRTKAGVSINQAVWRILTGQSS